MRAVIHCVLPGKPNIYGRFDVKARNKVELAIKLAEKKVRLREGGWEILSVDVVE